MQKKVFGNVFFSLIDKAIVFVFSMFISIALARYLGASDYGRYTFFGVIYTFVNSFACFGMQQIVTKEFAAYENKRKAVLYAAIIVAFATGMITELGVLILQLITGFLSWLEVAVLGVICLFNVCQIFYYYLTATYQLKYVVKIKNIVLIWMVVIYIVLIMSKASVEWFILVYALKECGTLGVSFLAFLCSREKEKIRYQEAAVSEIFFIIGKLIHLCLPLLLGGLSVTIYMKIDQVMIKSMLGEEQLGIYSVGIKLVDAFFFIPPAVTAGLLPYFAKQYMEEPTIFWTRYERFASALNAIAYMYVIVLAVLGKWMIHFLYGEEYAEAYKILMVTIWTVIPVCMGCMRGIFLSIMEYSGLSFFFSIAAAVMNMAMNYLMIPVSGALGAAIASVISYWVQGFMLTFISPKLRQMTKVQWKSLYGFIFLIKEIKVMYKNVLCSLGKGVQD